jgi:hypothetical protein
VTDAARALALVALALASFAGGWGIGLALWRAFQSRAERRHERRHRPARDAVWRVSETYIAALRPRKDWR